MYTIILNKTIVMIIIMMMVLMMIIIITIIKPTIKLETLDLPYSQKSGLSTYIMIMYNVFARHTHS